MDWIQILIICLIAFVVLAIFFRRYITALIYDYLVDAGLSFADNLLAGAGAAGLDIGDWIAAVLVFFKERKITNNFVALLVAWEATNFLPFSLIPVVGEMIEVITNFFPAVTISRMLFAKYGAAEKEEKKLKKEFSVAKELGIKVSKEKEVLKDVKKLMDKEDPVDALKKAKKADEEISSKLLDYVNQLVLDTNKIIQDIISKNIQAPQELIDFLQQGIAGSEQLLQQAQNAVEEGDFEAAIDSATNAKKVILSAARQFNTQYLQYLSQMGEG